MIVIPRKRDEAIVIGDNIEIIIVDIRDDKVRFGINVPKEMPLHRGEVYEMLRRSQQVESTSEVPPPPASGD